MSNSIKCTTYTRETDGLVMIHAGAELWLVRKGSSCYMWSRETQDWFFIGGVDYKEVTKEHGPFLMSFNEAYRLLETLPLIK